MNKGCETEKGEEIRTSKEGGSALAKASHPTGQRNDRERVCQPDDTRGGTSLPPPSLLPPLFCPLPLPLSLFPPPFLHDATKQRRKRENSPSQLITLLSPDTQFLPEVGELISQ